MLITSRRKALSGIPLGGLGTGSIEIRADGRLYEWLIFNNKPWSGYGKPEFYMSKDDFLFLIRIKSEDEDPFVRILTTESWSNEVNLTYNVWSTIINPYQTPWVRCIEEIKFDGKPPFAFLEYVDSSFVRKNVEIKLEAFSPLIIDDVENSSIPVSIFVFKIKNNSSKTIEASLATLVRNPHNVGKNVKVVNEVIRKLGYTALLMRGEGISEEHGMWNGALVLATLSEESTVSSIVTDDKMNMVSRFREILVDFRDDGVFSGKENASVYGKDVYGFIAQKIVLEPKEEKQVIFILSWFYPNHIDLSGKIIGHYYENKFSSPIDVTEYVITNFDKLYTKTHVFIETIYDSNYDNWLSDLTSSQLTTFAKSTWFSKEGLFGIWEGGPGCCGLNTVDVALWAITGVILFYPELAKRIIRQTSRYILRPELSPYYEVFALAFPENMSLYREMLKQDPSIQHDIVKFKKAISEIVKKTGKDPKGRVPHFFTASFELVDTYDRSDLIPEYILISLLCYYWTGDRLFLDEVWSYLKETVDALLRLHDDAGLKLPYHSPPSGYEGFSQVANQMPIDERRKLMLRLLLSGPMFVPTTVNTFDALSLIGISIFTSDIWIAALKSLKDVAEETSDQDYATWLFDTLRIAIENVEKLLWNGEYYDLWYDPVTGYRDRACMSAGITGEWYLKVLLNKDYVLNRERVISTLKAIYKYNFKEWEGLLNASYPHQPRPSLKGNMKYLNEVGIPYTIGGQMDTPWTGIEIPVATHLIWEDMVEEGLNILRNVHDRYASWGLYWNHIECDGHYFRVLCSLFIPNALAGSRYMGSDKILEINPRINHKEFKGPILTPGALLHLYYVNKDKKLTVNITVKLGKIKLCEIDTKVSMEVSKLSVILNGKTLKSSFTMDKNALKIKFEEIQLKENDVLTITVS